MKELAGGGRNDVVYAWNGLVDGRQRCLRVDLLGGHECLGCLGAAPQREVERWISPRSAMPGARYPKRNSTSSGKISALAEREH